MKFFSMQDIETHPEELLQKAEYGEFAVVVPFDDQLLHHGVNRTMAVAFWEDFSDIVGYEMK